MCGKCRKKYALCIKDEGSDFVGNQGLYPREVLI